jgi:GT2 family glycosyltransferase
MAEKNIQASVVIPVYNGLPHLKGMLDSLVKQQDGNFEVIVADNGSLDKSVELAATYDSQLQLSIVEANGRPGKNFAINQGVACASADKLVFVDQDDQVNERYVASMSSALTTNAFVAASMDAAKLNSSFNTMPRYAPRNQRIGEFPIRIAAGGTLGIRRSAFEDVHGFDEDFNYSTGDVDFCYRLHHSGYLLQLVDDALLYYRFRPTTVTNFKQGIYYGQGNHAVGLRHPGSRAPTGSIAAQVGSIIGDSLHLIVPGNHDREKVAHRLGKSLGFMQAKVIQKRTASL